MKFLLILLLPVLAFGQDTEVQKEKIDVVVGKRVTKKLDFKPDTRILGGNSEFLEVNIIPSQKELIFVGKKSGNPNVIIKDEFGNTRLDIDVSVRETDNSKTVQKLEELIGDIEGIDIKIVAERVVVDGEIIVPKDIGRLVITLDQPKFKDVIVFVEPSPHTMALIAKRMQDEIQKQGMKDVTVRVVNDSFWLEGIVNDRNNKRVRAQNIARAFLPDRLESLARRAQAVTGNPKQYIRNFIQENEQARDVPLPKLIKVIAQFVELSKDYARTFGFQWAPTFTGGGGSITIGKAADGTVTSASENSLLATISNLFPKLSSAKNAGSARVLQSGMVVIEEKVEGNIVKSTSVPFSVGSGEFTRPTSANAQFNLRVTPEVLKDEKIKLAALNVTISSVTPQADGTQVTNENSVATAVVVNSGDSAVIGGVFQASSRNDYDKVPTPTDENGNSPDFLFNFVKAKNYTNTKSQFVVFVTPEIVEDPARDTAAIKRKFRRRRR